MENIKFTSIMNESNGSEMIEVKSVMQNSNTCEGEEAIMMDEQNTVGVEVKDDNRTTEIQAKQLKVVKPLSKSKTRANRSANGVCTIINSGKNGRRATLSKEVMELLNNPHCIEIGFTENGVVIGRELPENGVEFDLKKSGNKGVIYSSELVEEITEVFELDFSNRVSITFVDAEEIEYDGDSPIIEIKMK